MIGHIAPKASVGGPIAALRDGDIVTIDLAQRRVDVELSDAELGKRLEAWQPPSTALTGVMKKYARLVSSAARGAVTAAE